MKWKAYFFPNSSDNSYNERQEKYVFKTKKHPPHIKEMDNFEPDLIGLVKSIKFKKIHNNIQQQMSSDLRRIRESNYISTKSDKSGNLYKVDKNKYKQMIFKEVIEHYKKPPPPFNNLENELNNETKMLATMLGIVDRVEK